MGALHRIKQQSFKRSYATAPRRPIPPEVVQVMHQVRDYLASRGVRSLHKLVQSLRECCNDRTATVSQHELHRAFQLCGARVHDEDLALIFAHFNHDATGSIDFHEFMIGFIGELNARRLKLVRAAFNKLDSLGSGNLRAATAIQSFDAAVHPDVRMRQRTTEQVFREFHDTFDFADEHGVLSFDDWERYFAMLSACLQSDDLFEEIMTSCWHLGDSDKFSSSQRAKRSILVKHRDGRTSLQMMDDPAGTLDGSDSDLLVSKL